MTFVALAMLGTGHADGDDAVAAVDRQTILGPGLYIFQTRTRSASCWPTDGAAAGKGGPPALQTLDRDTSLVGAKERRCRNGACEGGARDGYVLSFIGAIHGVPYDVSMDMELNNDKFKHWRLRVIDNRRIVGESRSPDTPEAPDSEFDVERDGERYKGRGFRSYNVMHDGVRMRCRVDADVLLRRIDV